MIFSLLIAAATGLQAVAITDQLTLKQRRAVSRWVIAWSQNKCYNEAVI